jgi:hypothetical protein
VSRAGVLALFATGSRGVLQDNLASPLWSHDGSQADSLYGSSIVVGQVTGTANFLEVVVSAPNYSGSAGTSPTDSETWMGRVYVYQDVTDPGVAVQPEATVGPTLNGDITCKYRSYFGRNLALGNINGDSYDDLLISAAGCSSDDGRIFAPEGGGSSDSEFNWGSECSSGTGTFTSFIALNAWIDVGIIPINRKDVFVRMKALGGVDIDTYLEDITDSTVKRIVGYYQTNNLPPGGYAIPNWLCNYCVNSAPSSQPHCQHDTVSYDGVSYKYSGHYCPFIETGTGCPCDEWIEITGVTNKELKVRVQGFAEGTATVDYGFSSSCQSSDDGRAYSVAGGASFPGTVSDLASTNRYAYNGFGSATLINSDGSLVVSSVGQEGGSSQGYTEFGTNNNMGAGNTGAGRTVVSPPSGDHTNNIYYGQAMDKGYFTTDASSRSDAMDLVVGAPRASYVSSYAGYVEVRASASGNARLWRGDGSQMGAGYGMSLHVADFDGDSYPDLAVGSPFFTNGAPETGKVIIYYGRERSGATSLRLSAGTTLSGLDSSGRFGYSLAHIDTNQDGIMDLVVGAPYASSGLGKVFIYLGAASPTGLATTATQTITGNLANGLFGYSLSNGVYLDDLSSSSQTLDLVIGQPGANSKTGRVVALSGRPNVDLYTTVAGVYTGAGSKQFVTESPGLIVFTVTVGNGGPAIITNVVTVSITLDPSFNLSSVSYSVGEFSCVTTSNPVVCTSIGTIASSASRVITVNYEPLSEANAPPSPTITTAATVALPVSTTLYDATATDWSATETGSVVAVADLEVDQSSIQLEAIDEDGNQISSVALLSDSNSLFVPMVRFRNVGPSPAFGIEFAAVLSTGVFAMDTGRIHISGPGASGFDCSAVVGRLSCLADSLEVSAAYTVFQNLTFGFDVGLAASVVSITFSASASQSLDQNSSQNSITTTSRTIDLTSAAITMTATNNTALDGIVCAGNLYNYRAIVTGKGPNSASNVVLVQTLDLTRVSFIRAFVSNGAPCVLNTTGSYVTCLLGSVGKGANIEVINTVRVLSTTTVVDRIPATFTLRADATVNVTTSELSVFGPAVCRRSDVAMNDLRVTSSSGSAMPTQGETLTLRVVAVNQGPSDLLVGDSGLVTVTFPVASVGVNPAEALPSGCTNPSSGTVECTLGGLVLNERKVLDMAFVVTASPADAFNISAVVSTGASSDDTVSSNNALTTRVSIDKTVDVSVSYTLTPTPPIFLNDDIYLRATLRNTGANDATSVTATFTINLEMAQPSSGALVDSSRGTCVPTARSGSPGGWDISCTGISLAKGGSDIVVVLVHTVGSVSGFFSSTASAQSVATDSFTSNNQVTLSSTISRPCDLALTAGAASPSPVSFTDTNFRVPYTVRNLGPFLAANASLTVPYNATLLTLDVTATLAALPANVTFAGSTFRFGDMALNALSTVQMVFVPVTGTPIGTVFSLTGSVTASSSTPERSFTNNAVTKTVTLSVPSSDLQYSSIRLTPASALVGPSSNFTMTVTVVNNGPNTLLANEGVLIVAPIDDAHRARYTMRIVDSKCQLQSASTTTA